MSADTALLIVFGVLFLIVIILFIWAIAIYNGLVSKRELVNEGWSSIDVQLKRRFNLIKNLVRVVKQYASHEAVTLENLTNARSAAYTDDVGERASAESQIGSALVNMLSSSLALAELQLAEASILSLRASLVSQPSLILQFVGQNYPSWWTTCRGLFQHSSEACRRPAVAQSARSCQRIVAASPYAVTERPTK